MAKLILFLDRLINFYMYYVVMACFLSLVPNINYDYPLFHSIFKSAGFYLIPPIFGVSFSPMVIMTACVLVSIGLGKIYKKYCAPKEPSVVIMSKDEFVRKMNDLNKKIKEDKKDDDTDISD